MYFFISLLYLLLKTTQRAVHLRGNMVYIHSVGDFLDFRVK